MAHQRDDREQLAALADELLRQAAEIRRQWAELAEVVGVEPPGEDGSAAAGGADPAQMRLVALDMMLSGATADQIAEHLRTTFGRDDVDGIVSEVFDQYG